MNLNNCPICHSLLCSFFGKRLAYRYFRCGECGHLFIYPKPSPKVLKELYTGSYDFRVDATSLHRFRAMAGKIISKLGQLRTSGKTLLDIGAGYGTFVEVATINGLKAMGIEPAYNLYSSALTKLKNKVLHTDLRTFSRTHNKKFDFITAIHVIEHVSDPKDFLTTALNLLEPRGVLYVETPNSDGYLARFEKENYTFLTPPDHLNLFSMTSFEALIGSVALGTRSSYHTYSYPEHLVGILRILKRNLKHKSSPPPYDLRGRTAKRVIVQSAENASTRIFFDTTIAPLLTPLLNLGNRGTFLQVYIQRMN